MKTKLLLLTATFIIFIHFTNAQCNTSAFDFGNNTTIAMYNVSGDVDIILNTDDTVTLNLGSNFRTAAGPDIRAFFVASNGASDAVLRSSLISSLENFEFGLVGAIGSVNQNGAKSFTVAIPSGANIQDYDRVFFYCLQFDQFWDFGDIAPFTPSNCSLSVEENTLSENITFYPNPTSENITINNHKQLNIDVEIYDLLGKRVLRIKNNTLKEQLINLSSLQSGVYLMQIKTEKNSITKKFLKQ